MRRALRDLAALASIVSFLWLVIVIAAVSGAS